MQTALEDDNIAPVFKLSVLKKLYTDRVNQLGEGSSVVHSTRFKNKVLSYFPELEAHNEGRDVLLVANANIGKSLRSSCQLDGDSEAVFISRAANIVRRDMLRMKCLPFSGSFKEDCQENSVPHSLLMLVTMIMYGTDIQNQENYLSQPALSVSQLMTYNSCVRRRQQPSLETRHTEQRETPLPLFHGSLIHSRTRSRDLVDTLYRLGLSVSYDLVLGMSADLGNSAISHLESIGTVCPPALQIGVFTTSAVDNIDHDPTATSAHGSFHGTGISLFQHPNTENCGTEQMRIPLTKSGKKVRKLPESYTLVPAVSALKNGLPVPEVCGLMQSDCSLMTAAVAEEQRWCDHISNVVDDGNADKDIHVSWGAYHATRIESSETTDNGPTAVSALLPLFPDDSKSIAMIRHSMEEVKKAVAILNPGQFPVIACDQPLFKLAKNIQWMWPETYGEGSFLVMLGGLHIKMTLLKALGDLLGSSGWTSAIVQADIATPRTADSFLKATHVKRTARAHQVTACTLHKLLHEYYTNYQVSQADTDAVSFEEWCKCRAEACPQFYFWQLVLETQLNILVWDRSIHEGNFLLYVDALTQLEWLFYALDHYNYARAVSIHLRDMVVLSDKQPGDGGAVGLTENPAALLRWMAAGPEISRVVGEFQSELDRKEAASHSHHHEDKPASVTFANTSTASAGCNRTAVPSQPTLNPSAQTSLTASGKGPRTGPNVPHTVPHSNHVLPPPTYAGSTSQMGQPPATCVPPPAQAPPSEACIRHPPPLPNTPPLSVPIPHEAMGTLPPPRPLLKLGRADNQGAIVLQWSVAEPVQEATTPHRAPAESYHIYAYHEDIQQGAATQWKKIGDVQALPLPMACTLTQFMVGSRYYFTVRAKDKFGRFSPFCEPQCADLKA
uniref:uncharacterized protein isoform X2 n=1 Tax=Myxine glutinosa TaxID=7769 RepID=UPI00358DF98B